MFSFKLIPFHATPTPNTLLNKFWLSQYLFLPKSRLVNIANHFPLSGLKLFNKIPFNVRIIAIPRKEFANSVKKSLQKSYQQNFLIF